VGFVAVGLASKLSNCDGLRAASAHGRGSTGARDKENAERC